MKTIFNWLAVGVAVAITNLPGVCGAASLSDFGYGNMTTKRTVPTVLILVNFTNNNGNNAPYTVPYAMGPNLVGTDYTAAVRWYSNWFFSKTSSPKSVNGYFHEMSNGRMQWTTGAVFMVTKDTNDLYGAIFDREDENGDAADSAYITKMIRQAMAQGLDLLSYDTFGNGIVDGLECTIQLITNDETFGGGTRSYGLALGLGFSFYTGKVTIQRFTHGMNVIVEELVHVLQAGHCGDIYGPSSMSAGFSVMTGGTYVHVDSWHKVQLAWCEPRIHSLRQPGQFTLPAAQLMDSNGPVILYDPLSNLRETREFFVLEYRSTNTVSKGEGYDRNVKDSGLVIWHAQQGGGKDPVNWTATYFGLRKWWRCANCRGLFSTGPELDDVCPQGSAHHEGEDGYIGVARGGTDGGVLGWRGCQKCGQMFYYPNASTSVCPVGDQHQADPTDYSLRRDDDPESLGQRGWLHCYKCQVLFRPVFYDDKPDDYGVCAGSGAHDAGTNTATYAVLWGDGVNAMMTEGSPDMARGRGNAWHGGVTTPLLRWFDGTLSGTRIYIHPFAANSDQITIDVLANYDTWVDFPYTGAEEGTFQRPYNTFHEGVDVLYPGGTLHVKSGTSLETGRVTKSMKIEAYGGPVTIGRP